MHCLASHKSPHYSGICFSMFEVNFCKHQTQTHTDIYTQTTHAMYTTHAKTHTHNAHTHTGWYSQIRAKTNANTCTHISHAHKCTHTSHTTHTHPHTHIHTHTRTPHTLTHSHTHTRRSHTSHIHTNTHTYAHTQTRRHAGMQACTNARAQATRMQDH